MVSEVKAKGARRVATSLRPRQTQNSYWVVAFGSHMATVGRRRCRLRSRDYLGKILSSQELVEKNRFSVDSRKGEGRFYVTILRNLLPDIFDRNAMSVIISNFIGHPQESSTSERDHPATGGSPRGGIG
jgi:hypothetical protein